MCWEHSGCAVMLRVRNGFPGKHRWIWGERRPWILWVLYACYVFYFRAEYLSLPKTKYSIPLEQLVHLQLGFGLVHFVFLTSASCLSWAQPSGVWSSWIHLHCIPGHSLFYFILFYFIFSVFPFWSTFLGSPLCIMYCGCLSYLLYSMPVRIRHFLDYVLLYYFHVCTWLYDI